MSTRRHRFVTVDVFTDRRFGGNPLAVFPEAEGIADAEMQALAAELNLSETTFVLPPADPANTARVRIFTRTTEMPFAGHPNVGTGYVLAGLGRRGNGVLRFEELAGLVEVRIERGADGAVAGATIAAPQPLSTAPGPAPALVAACAGLAEGEVLATAHPPLLASVGNPFIIAQVTPDALGRAAPDIGAFRAALAAWSSPASPLRLALYLYAAGGEPGRVRARMFAPLGGTFEDAATGSAATPLSALLLSLSGKAEHALEVVQGVEMGRPSLLRTTARRDAGGGIRATVGGACVPVLEGWASL